MWCQHPQLKSLSSVCGTTVLDIYLSGQIFRDLQSLFQGCWSFWWAVTVQRHFYLSPFCLFAVAWTSAQTCTLISQLILQFHSCRAAPLSALARRRHHPSCSAWCGEHRQAAPANDAKLNRTTSSSGVKLNV